MFSITLVPNPRRAGGVTVGPPASIQRGKRFELTGSAASGPSDFNATIQLPITIRILPHWLLAHEGRLQSSVPNIWLQHYGRSVNSHTLLFLAPVRQKLLCDQTVKLCSCPSRLHEQPMDLCEGIDAPFDRFLEIIRRIGTGEPHCRQHSRQDVLGSMLGLVCEIDDLRLATFALSYVTSDLRCADDCAFCISER